ncbi:MAG: type II secretion system F family protein [Pseudomonadota bacterium]|nr:type II secretion system F family protein [Pseudomonadota bacterium]
MDTEYSIFLVMVFLAVFGLVVSLVIPSFGTGANTAKRMRSRVNTLLGDMDISQAKIVREKYLSQLTAWERSLEELPGMDHAALWIEQSGNHYPAYRLLISSLVLMTVGLIIALIATNNLPISLIAGLALSTIPWLKLRYDRSKRLTAFEEQLPEALDMMTRAMRAGHPFTETLNLVAEEMPDPIAGEFGKAYSDINYGIRIKVSFMEMLRRVPSVSMMAVVTAILIQRDVGGNMSEILTKIAAVVRSRFRFQRRVRTLTAEGRISVWVLTLVPFALAAALWFTTPDYLPMLVKDPLGRQLVTAAFFLLIVGFVWVRRLIRIEV